MANRLQFETSPYLLQHAHNPVAWWPWSDAAFEAAKQADMPVLVSIGYATCHWCHVMEKESFEDAEIAAFMNEHFICIKVDREEHPDVDHFYMDALQAMQQSGGWPLNMFVTPDRQPFYGGTYFPPQKIYHRASWKEVLEAVIATWQQKRDEIQHQSGQLVQHLQQSYQYERASAAKDISVEDILQAARRQYDDLNGGFNTAPKFPQFNVLQMMATLAKLYPETDAKEMLHHSLDKMLHAGIYDAISGGICRYATDAQWKVPHFEKMLYDNALLLSTLAMAYSVENKVLYKHSIEKTLQFLDGTFYKDGLYWSALDADSEGVEGKYYVWTYQELMASPSCTPAIIAYFDIQEQGNWEHGKNILHAVVTDENIVKDFQLLPKQWTLMKQQFLMDLQYRRAKRIPPITDTKILLHQNALLATAMLKAYKALGNENYKQKGLQLLEAILASFLNIQKNQVLHQAATNKDPQINLAKLDDVAYLIQAMLQAYSIAPSQQLQTQLQWLMTYVITHFSGSSEIMFYYSDVRQTDILVRKTELYDGAMLSSNAVMCENLWFWGQIQTDYTLTSRARQMIMSQSSAIARYPIAFATWAQQYFKLASGWDTVKKNAPVTSFEHFLFYEHFADSQLLVHSAWGVEEEEVGISENKAPENEIEFMSCSEGHCKVPVKSIFQLF